MSCRKDSLLTHRAFCDALAEESARIFAAAANNNGSTVTTTTNSSNGGGSDLLFSNNNSSVGTPLFLPFPNPPPPAAPAAAAAQNPNAFYFLHQHDQQLAAAPFLHPRMVLQPSPYLDFHADAAASVTTATTGAGGGIGADTVNFGLAPDGSVAALRACATGGHRRLTRDFLGVDGGVRQVEELQLPLYATAATAATVVPRAASCATDLTRQYLGERPLPPVNEAWTNF